MWIQRRGAHHSCPKVRLPQYGRVLKSHILRGLQCDNLGTGYALYIFHKRQASPESETLGGGGARKKKKKGSASRYILTESVWQSSGSETETLVRWTIGEGARHLLSQRGKQPNTAR